MSMDVLILFFHLVIGHCIGDYVLQLGHMSSAKSRHSKLREQYGEDFPQWYYWLTAHSFTHAAIVIIITGSNLFAVIEAVSHWVIDFCKCEKWISLHQDQVCHMAFKILYCVVFYMSTNG